MIEYKIEDDKNCFIFNKYTKITKILLNDVQHANNFF